MRIRAGEIQSINSIICINKIVSRKQIKTSYGFKLNIEKLYNDMDYFEKSISPQSNAAAIKHNHLKNNL